MIVGAAGRDFHNFNLVYRGRGDYEVVAFTATQIPNIEGRVYPPALAGELYPNGIPIVAEDDLEPMIARHGADEVVFAYSDVTHEHVMHIGSRALAAGASFRLLSPKETMLTSSKPVVAVCAVRTGSGKSQTTRYVAELLRRAGKRVPVPPRCRGVFAVTLAVERREAADTGRLLGARRPALASGARGGRGEPDRLGGSNVHDP